MSFPRKRESIVKTGCRVKPGMTNFVKFNGREKNEPLKLRIFVECESEAMTIMTLLQTLSLSAAA
jgi:hypothetical protein